MKEIMNGGLVLAADMAHLVEGRFNTDRMLNMLQEALEQALKDGLPRSVGVW